MLNIPPSMRITESLPELFEAEARVITEKLCREKNIDSRKIILPNLRDAIDIAENILTFIGDTLNEPEETFYNEIVDRYHEISEILKSGISAKDITRSADAPVGDSTNDNFHIASVYLDLLENYERMATELVNDAQEPAAKRNAVAYSFKAMLAFFTDPA